MIRSQLVYCYRNGVACTKVARHPCKVSVVGSIPTGSTIQYHELRGSDYRHGVRDEDWYVYNRAMKELREQFATEVA